MVLLVQVTAVRLLFVGRKANEAEYLNPAIGYAMINLTLLSSGISSRSQ
jgi:hypothetical protein